MTLFSTLKPFPCRRWSTENLVPIRPMEGQELPMHMVSSSVRARNTPASSTRPTDRRQRVLRLLTDGVHARRRNYLSFLLLLQCTYFPPGTSLY